MTFSVESIIQGYAQGHFLMAEGAEPVEWFYTNKRTLMPLDHRFCYPKSLQRILNQNRFEVKINQAFEQVVEGCADRPETWISRELKQIYADLNQAGWAYSFETWFEGNLAGGILGISINGAFIGESMFYRVPDSSKVAMVKLVEHLRLRGYVLFDVQMMNPHLARFGALEVGDRPYRKLLDKALQTSCTFI
jgi:leucyl/phenylalanyl-tRNA---protein transferase